ncbi:uncharacterized protein LOC129276438 [Lytechinus pictus]|uniref:uncharacterized protein LOC129276438 n=1 Tax=Lytechinus pictus TaxID=7653 RepID=UPI0030B9C5D7
MRIVFISLFILLMINDSWSTSQDDLGQHVVVQRSLPPDDRVITAFDSLLSKEIISFLRSYVMGQVRWEVRGHEPEHCTLVTETGQTDCQNSAASSIPWTGRLDPLWFSQTRTWKRLVEAISYATNDSSPTVYPFSIQSEVLRRGDNIAPRVVASSPYSREYALRIFLVSEWRKDDYGDMSFYVSSLQNRTKGSKYDIVLTVRPHPGRVVFWDASIPTLYRPPSMGYLEDLLSVSIQLTTSKEKFEAACKDWQELEEQKEQLLKQSFPHLSDSVGQLSLDNHLTRQFTDTEGRKVKIYDGVFEGVHLEALRSYLLSYPITNSQGYNLEQYELSDNVAWLKNFDEFDFQKSSTWDVLSQVATHATGKQRAWFPYDVSLNIVRSGDHTRLHEDCEEWEDEFTMVVYMNPDLGQGDYGETIFYNTKPLDAYSKKLYEGISLRDYDAFAAINPRFGRLVIFDGHIPHSARPPSTGYTKPRFSFAVKLAVSRKTAIIKKLREHIEDFGIPEDDLLDEIEEATFHQRDLDRSEEWLENKFRDLKHQLKEGNRRNLQRLREAL